jgi:ribonuclease BN (tRNA processing enzyme)
MDLTIVGCSGSFPGPDSASSCYLVEADGYRMLLDLGNGALGPLQRYAGLDQIDAVCISHLHGDHCLDMCSYQVFRTYHPQGPLPSIPVYGPPNITGRLDRATSSESSESMAASFDFLTLTPGTIEIGPFSVTTRHMNHPVETFGFRISHNGSTLAYSADTGPTDELVELARGADLLLCEASFPEADGLPPNLHLTARQAASHAARAGVRELIVTHLVPWNSREQVLAEAADAFPGPVSLAVPGARLRA